MYHRITVKIDTLDPNVPKGTVSEWEETPPEGIPTLGYDFSNTVEHKSLLVLLDLNSHVRFAGDLFDVEFCLDPSKVP